MERVFEKAVSILKAGHSFAIATLLESFGSTPRGEGTKMLILDDGSIYSTIGGGLPEATVILRGKELIKSGVSEIISTDMFGADPTGEISICGGSTKVMLCPVSPMELPVFEAIHKAMSSQTSVCYVIKHCGGTYAHFCVFEDGRIIGTQPVDEKTAKSLRDASIGASMHSEENDSVSFYIERVFFDGKVYILGGGHVALDLAKIADITDFKTAIIEDRAEFLEAPRFPFSERILIPSFEHLPTLNIRANDYIVVITRGHLYDLAGLKWALNTPAKYIGMIGSITKRDLLYAQLINEGISQEGLKQVHSPIGVKIGGNTPAEIAVSIIAELISVRSKKKNANSLI